MNVFQWWSLYCHSQIRSCGSLQFIGSVVGASAIALTAPLICQSAWAATLSNWSYNPDSHEFQVTLPEGITPRYFLMAEPARIVMDLPGVEVGAVQTQASYAGAVSQIRVAQFEPGLARVVIEFAPGTVLEPKQAELRRSGDHWILRPLIAGSTAPATPVAAQTAEPEAEATAPASASTVATAPPPVPAFPSANPLDQPIVPTPVADSAGSDDSLEDLPTIAESQPAIPSANVSVEDDLTAEIQGLALPVDSPPAAVELEPAATVTSDRAETASSVDLPAEPSASSQVENVENADAAAPMEIAVPEPPPSSVATEAVAAEDEAEENIADIPTPTLDASDTDTPTTDAPSTTARVTVPDLPVLEAEETASENVPVAPVPQPPVQTSERSEPPERSSAIAQQPTSLPDASDLPSVTFPTPNLPSGNGQVRVPAPAAPRVRPTPAPAASLDTTEATGSAADLVLPPTGISTQRPSGFSPQSITQSPVAGTEVVRVPAPPPLPTATPPPAASSSANSTTAQVNNGSVTFGQSLPNESSGQTVSTIDANIWLPADTVLKLQYPREQELTLDPQLNWQEVLVLSHDVVHPQTGQVILPTGTQVVGRFETGRQGSRFIAQAVSVGNRNVKLAAESASIDGDRDISDQDLLLNSGIGAAAATVIGGLSGIGLLAGIAAGAATTYVTAPQPAVIQPYQMIEVRVLEDVTHSEIAQIQ
ncbi:MAG: AMIN domain-containing protein [Thainema sp.]